MRLISFRDLKLFKAPPAKTAARQQKAAPAAVLARLIGHPALLIILSALIFAYLIAYLPSRALTELQPGDIAAEDIVAPADLTIEDIETTDKRRAEASDSVLPLYALDPNVLLNSADKIRGFFAFGREGSKTAKVRDYAGLQKSVLDAYSLEISIAHLQALDRAGFAEDIEGSLLSLLEKISAPGVVLSKGLFVNREIERGFTLIRDGQEKSVRASEILDVKEARERLKAEIDALELSSLRKTLLTALAAGFLVPNVTYNKVETEIRKANAWSAVETVFFTIKKGRVILRKGDEAGPEAVKLISYVNRILTDQGAWFRSFAGTFLLFGLLFTTLWYYLKSLVVSRTSGKYFLMMLLTVLLSLLLYKLILFLAGPSGAGGQIALLTDSEAYKYVLPFQFGTILFAFLTTNAVALIFTVLNSILVGYLVNGDFFLLLFCLIGGLAAIYGIKFYGRQRRTHTLRAGFFVIAPLNIFIAVTVYLVRQKTPGLDHLAVEALFGVLGGLFSGALAFVLLPIYESLFRFVTQTRLLELTSSENAVLRQMALEAPGSYHHSLIVAALAEKAAEAIKLDPLLVKAGALYHDIGKIKMPEYFIENRDRKHDAHKDLTPSMSTLVIINHVKEGVEIARKERLPEQIKDIVEQHHGNSIVRYFFQKAKEKYDPEIHKVGEESYRYPGPTPQSKEAALVMLADSVEAASRSLRSHKDESLTRVIRDIFDNYLQDGQLDDCAFSLRELRAIAQSFLTTLHTIYQRRVEYPGFDFESRKKPEADDDRDHRPTEKEPDRD